MNHLTLETIQSQYFIATYVSQQRPKSPENPIFIRAFCTGGLEAT
ncbi:MAG: hypothetical protein ACK41S_12095 [Planctomycetota bacterium]|jgi:hypothetical protein